LEQEVSGQAELDWVLQDSDQVDSEQEDWVVSEQEHQVERMASEFSRL